MFDVDDIRDWRGRPVLDQEGAKIGTLEAIYFDTSTEQPTFATVKVGMMGNARLVFVPLTGARVAPKHLRVMVDKRLARDAPSIDAEGELQAEVEPTIFAHYGLPYGRGSGGERRLGRR